MHEARPVHDDVRFEQSDVSLPGVVSFGVGLVALGVAVYLSASWLFTVLDRQHMRKGLSVTTFLERPRLPRDLTQIPSPRLEESDTQQLSELRRHEDDLLQRYGWVDAKKGSVRIPIEAAMHLLADPATAAKHGVRVRETGTSRARP